MKVPTMKMMAGSGRFLPWIRYRIGEAFLRGFTALLPWLPESFFSALTRLGSRLAYYVLWKYPRRMEENLLAVMGKEFPSRRERRDLVRKAWSNFALGVHETAYSLNISQDELRSTVAIEGEEHLKKALERKKGVVALSAHIGNFTLIGAYLAAKGYPYNVIIKQPRDERFARLMDRYRLKVGIKTISARPRRLAAQRILKVLRANEVVLIIADELKSTGAEVEFFGRLFPFPRGPITLAMRSGAAIIPMFMTRDLENHLTLQIAPEMNLQQTGNLQEDVTANVALFSQHLESIVRRYPDQWNWLGFRHAAKRPRRTAISTRPKPPVTLPKEDLPSLGPRPPL